VKIIRKIANLLPSKLGAFAPWREEFPTPSIFDARLFVQAAQIFCIADPTGDHRSPLLFVFFAFFVAKFLLSFRCGFLPR
jgi:hypothetical protein